jgi:uncharacterized membrane protein YjdF
MPAPTEAPALAATDAERRASRACRIVAVAATLAFAAISLAASGEFAKYRWSFVFLAAIVWGAFALRRRLLLLPSHFALFAVALLLHDLGAFGWYRRTLAGLQFDWCVHAFFGMVGGLVLARLLERSHGLRGWTLAWLVVLAVAGLSALHEIVEAASQLALGAELGMYVAGPGNEFDTQEDLLSGVIGACTALALRARSARGRDERRG